MTHEASLDLTGQPIVSKLRDCYPATVTQGRQGQIPLLFAGDLGKTDDLAADAFKRICLGAYAMVAKKVTAIAIQRPTAFEKESDHIEKLGGTIEWPVFTEKVSEKGLQTKDGCLTEANTVIISIGERPDLLFIPREWLTERGMCPFGIWV